jgi:hypothetical protein
VRRRIAFSFACLLLVGCGREPALLRQTHKSALAEAMRAALLASAGAEKSAVMATTDEESQAFAEESRRHTSELVRLRDELHGSVAADARPAEMEALAVFDRALGTLRNVDQRLLALAVANSNLKAARLAAGEGAVVLDRLVDALLASSGDADALRRRAAAAVAALRIQVLLAPHIASADDAEMSRLEARMRVLGEAVPPALADAGPDTAAAWADYERLTAEVIRLSRQNTNVVSIDVSLNEKRRVTQDCLDALDRLLDAVRAGPDATR